MQLSSVVSLDALTATPADLSDDDLYIGLENIGPSGELIGLGDVRVTSLQSNKNRFTSHDVLFGKLRPYLTKVARPTRAGVCSTDIIVLQPSDSLNRDYLYWWLRSPTVIEDATARSTGATLPRISPSTLGEFEIPVPTLAEQQRIVAKLDEVDAGLRTLSERLDAELLRSLKIQRSVARDTMPASSGQMMTLGDVVSIEIGRTPPRADPAMWDPMRQSGAIWVSIADLSACRGRIITDSKEYISRAAATASRHVRAGTLMMSFKLSIGKLAFAGRDLYTNEAIAALTVKNPDQLISDFLFHYLSNVEWSSFAAGNEKVKGATLNKAKLAVVPLPVPTLSEQQRIVARLDELQLVCAEVSANIERRKSKAVELRQSVLAAAFRGDL